MAIKDKFLPSLGAEGWLSNKKAIMEKLFTYYIASEYNQTNTFYTQVKSLKYDLFISYDEHAIRSRIEDSLTKLYSPYFDSVEFSSKLTEKEGSKLVEITIDVKCTYGNETYTLSKIIESNFDDSIILNFDTLMGNIYGS